MKNEKLTKERAEKLADELIASAPRVKDSNLAKIATLLHDHLSSSDQGRPGGPEMSPLNFNQFRNLDGSMKH